MSRSDVCRVARPLECFVISTGGQAERDDHSWVCPGRLKDDLTPNGG
jgi:hypothetical protein